MNTRQSISALIAACHERSCAPPPVGSGGSIDKGAVKRFPVGTPTAKIETAAAEISAQNPDHYIVVKNDFGAAIYGLKRLRPDTPRSTPLKYYWKNGKRRAFTDRQRQRAQDDAQGSGGDGAKALEDAARSRKKSKARASAEMRVNTMRRVKGQIWSKRGEDRWERIDGAEIRTNAEMDELRRVQP